jgi:hypothetical protein
MVNDIKWKIEHFFSAFNKWHEFVINECNDRIEGLILSCVFLDSLAGYKLGPGNVNNRFVNFILDYSGQRKLYEKVSLPKLRYDLIKRYGPNDSKTKALESNFQLDEFYFTTQGHCVDVNWTELKETLSSQLGQVEVDTLQKLANNFTYVQILYDDYRCKLVHEARVPLTMNISESEEPYYINILMSEDIKDQRTLFRIPPTFIIGTLRNCIDNFREECTNDGIDPLANRQHEII